MSEQFPQSNNFSKEGPPIKNIESTAELVKVITDLLREQGGLEKRIYQSTVNDDDLIVNTISFTLEGAPKYYGEVTVRGQKNTFIQNVQNTLEEYLQAKPPRRFPDTLIQLKTEFRVIDGATKNNEESNQIDKDYSERVLIREPDTR